LKEVACGLEDWLAIQGSFAAIGLQVFATSNVHLGKRTKGVVTLVKQGVGATQVATLEEWCGTCLAITIGRTLILNSYAPPRQTHLMEHLSNLDEFLVGLSWRGSQLWCGDWNETMEESGIAALAAHYSLRHIAFLEDCGTRWVRDR